MVVSSMVPMPADMFICGVQVTFERSLAGEWNQWMIV